MLEITCKEKASKKHANKQNNPQTKLPYTHDSTPYSEKKRKKVDNDTPKNKPYLCKQLLSSLLSDHIWIFFSDAVVVKHKCIVNYEMDRPIFYSQEVYSFPLHTKPDKQRRW